MPLRRVHRDQCAIVLRLAWAITYPVTYDIRGDFYPYAPADTCVKTARKIRRFNTFNTLAHVSFMATRVSYAAAQAVCFTHGFFSFLAANLRGHSDDRHQIMRYVRRRPEFIKLGHKFGGPPPPKKKNGGPKHQNWGISDKRVITGKIKHAIKLKISHARLAQLLQTVAALISILF